MDNLSILLVEDSPLFRLALTNVLSRNKAFILDVCSSKFFLRRIAKLYPNAVLIDAITWTSGPQALVDGVKRASMLAPIILLGREDLVEKHMEALRAGAVAFVRQTARPQVLIKAVRAVAAGGVWFERELFRKVFFQGYSPVPWPRGICLNEKEQRILAFVADGKTNKEIGAQLGLTERTVKAYVSNLLRKVGRTNRSSLASYAILHGVIPTCADGGES